MTAAVAVGVWGDTGGSGVMGDLTSGCGLGACEAGTSEGFALFLLSASELPVSTVMTTATTMAITTTTMPPANARRRQ